MNDINKIICGTVSETNGHVSEFTFFPTWKIGDTHGSVGRKPSALILFEDEQCLRSSGKTTITGLGWSYEAGSGINARINGACYNPIYDSVIITSTGDDADNHGVISLDRSTGEKNWGYNTGDVNNDDCAVDNDGNVYAASQNGLRKFNGLTGSLLWTRTNIKFIGCDAGFIGSTHGVVACGIHSILLAGINLILFDTNGSIVWEQIVPSWKWNPLYTLDLSTCRIYGESKDVLTGGNRQSPGAEKSLWRINGGNGAIIWDLDLGDSVQPPLQYLNDTFSYGKCIDYDDQGNIWCGVDRNNNLGEGYFRLAKISSGGVILDTFEFGSASDFEVTPHVTMQANEPPIFTTTEEPLSTTTEEPSPCEVSNLLEYGYIKKDGVRILIRKTEGNEIKLIRPIPPEWVIGTKLKLIPGCNKTLCDCNFKWDNLENFLGLGIKMPMSNPLTADRGANPR